MLIRRSQYIVSFIFVAILTGCASTTPTKPVSQAVAPPQKSQKPEPQAQAPRSESKHDLSRYIAWMQKAQLVYNRFLAVLEEYQEIDLVSAELMQKHIPVNQANEKVRHHIQAVKKKFQEYRVLEKQLVLPDLKSPRLSRNVRRTKLYLETLHEQAKQGFLQSLKLYDSASSGKPVSAVELAARRLDHYIAVLDAENAMMRSSSALTNAKQPQHHLYKSIIASNSAAVSILRYYLDKIEGQDTPAVIYIQEGQTNLSASRRANTQGRSVAQFLAVKLSNQKASRSQAEVRNTMVRVMRSYQESFSVEESVANVMDTALATLETDNEDEDVLATVAPLIQQRLTLQQERQALVRSVADRL